MWGLLNCNSTQTHIEELIFFSLITQTNSLLRVHTASMWSHTGAAGGGGQLWHHDNPGGSNSFHMTTVGDGPGLQQKTAASSRLPVWRDRAAAGVVRKARE